MSDPVSTNDSAVVDTSQDTEAAPAQESAGTEAAAEPQTEAQAEPKFEYPAKFMKADGTPDYEKLAKSYVGLEKKLGAKPNIPAASADEYEWQAPDDGVELDETGVTQFKTEALEQGFTAKQYQFLMTRYNDIVVGMRDAGPTADKAEQVLKAEWGNDYKQQLIQAKAGFDEFAPSTANPQDPVWNHPEVLKLLARVGSEVSEDSIAPKASAAAGSGETVQAQIAALRASADYWKPEVQAKVNALYEKLAK
jgi:hypothetical protein